VDWNNDGLDEIVIAEGRGLFDGHGKRLATFAIRDADLTNPQAPDAAEMTALVADMTGDGVPESALWLLGSSGGGEHGAPTAGCRLQAVRQTPEAAAPRPGILGLALPALAKLPTDRNGIEHPPQRQDGCQMLLGRAAPRVMSCLNLARIVLLGTTPVEQDG